MRGSVQCAILPVSGEPGFGFVLSEHSVRQSFQYRRYAPGRYVLCAGGYVSDEVEMGFPDDGGNASEKLRCV